MQTFEYQDAIGSSLLAVASSIPAGMLCFFPSYRMLEKMSDRWKTTGVWAELEKKKQIFSEARGNQETFETLLNGYRCVPVPSVSLHPSVMPSSCVVFRSSVLRHSGRALGLPDEPEEVPTTVTPRNKGKPRKGGGRGGRGFRGAPSARVKEEDVASRNGAILFAVS